MKRVIVILLMLAGLHCRPQGNSDINTNNLVDEVAKLKEVIKGLQENEIQSEKIKYMRNFQLMDVIDKTLEDNINALPLVDGEKIRLKGQVSGLVEGLKRTFPPLQIIS